MRVRARRVPNWFCCYVWRETGAFRSARPSRGRAASTRKRTEWREDATLLVCSAGQFDCRDVTGITEREITSAYNLVSIYFLISECKTAKRLDCE